MTEPATTLPPPSPPPSNPPQQENMWLNIAANIIVPVMLLKKGPKWFGLEPGPVLIIALAFPTLYFIYDWVQRKKINWIAILGFISVLLTGGIGLLKIPTKWFAVKEAGIPLVIGLATLGSMFTRKPLVRAFLMNRSVMDVDRVESALDARGTHAPFGKLLKSCTGWLAASFFLSAVLNFVLARMIVKSPSGSEAFNDEVGTMTWVSYLVIMIPSMALMMFVFFKLGAGIKRLTGLEFEETLWAGQKALAKEQAAKEAKAAEAGTESSEDTEPS